MKPFGLGPDLHLAARAHLGPKAKQTSLSRLDQLSSDFKMKGRRLPLGDVANSHVFQSGFVLDDRVSNRSLESRQGAWEAVDQIGKVRQSKRGLRRSIAAVGIEEHSQMGCQDLGNVLPAAR